MGCTIDRCDSQIASDAPMFRVYPIRQPNDLDSMLKMGTKACFLGEESSKKGLKLVTQRNGDEGNYLDNRSDVYCHLDSFILHASMVQEQEIQLPNAIGHRL